MAKKTPKIVVLGVNGMLGSMVDHYLRANTHYHIVSTSRRSDIIKAENFDALQFLHRPNHFSFLRDADYIINCIGIIKPHCHDDNIDQVWSAVQINATFPHQLARNLADRPVKILQIATDCVYSGRKGQYVETDIQDPLDVYGKTKSLGEGRYNNLLNLRCSIIGPEQGTSFSLLEWFLHQEPGASLSGFQHHLWNGITTLQFAQLCEHIINQEAFEDLRAENHVHHVVPNTTVTKYQLLTIFQKVFNTNYKIEKVTAAMSPVPSIDRTLATQLRGLAALEKSETMETAINSLQQYMKKNRLSLYGRQ